VMSTAARRGLQPGRRLSDGKLLNKEGRGRQFATERRGKVRSPSECAKVFYGCFLVLSRESQLIARQVYLVIVIGIWKKLIL
jgi:hypothetical protein